MRQHKAHKAINFAQPARGTRCGAEGFTCLARDWGDVTCKRCLKTRQKRAVSK